MKPQEIGCACTAHKRVNRYGFSFRPFWETRYYPATPEVSARFWQREPTPGNSGSAPTGKNPGFTLG